MTCDTIRILTEEVLKMDWKKQERFVVIATVLDDSQIQNIAFSSYSNYPSDDELSTIWDTADKSFSKVFYINVEKQVRFE
jgi:hypothetical protein